MKQLQDDLLSCALYLRMSCIWHFGMHNLTVLRVTGPLLHSHWISREGHQRDGGGRDCLSTSQRLQLTLPNYTEVAESAYNLLRHTSLPPHPNVIKLSSEAHYAPEVAFYISLNVAYAPPPAGWFTKARGRLAQLCPVSRWCEWRRQLRNWKRNLLMGLLCCEAPDLEETWGAHIPPENGRQRDSPAPDSCRGAEPVVTEQRALGERKKINLSAGQRQKLKSPNAVDA